MLTNVKVWCPTHGWKEVDAKVVRMKGVLPYSLESERIDVPCAPCPECDADCTLA